VAQIAERAYHPAYASFSENYIKESAKFVLSLSTKKMANPITKFITLTLTQAIILLLLCANCHARFEHAGVTGIERTGGWVTAFRIGNKRFAVRQALAHTKDGGSSPLFQILLFGLQAGVSAICLR
jgi:hypothetical protein